MLKKVNLKKSISIIAIAVMALVLMVAPASVQAASNPLAKMPTKYSGVAYKKINWIGTYFSTPNYDSKVTIKVKNSNPKVAKVTCKNEVASDDRNRKKYAGSYTITPISAGTAKIYVKVTVKGKTYTKTCSIRSYKWESPFTALKIGFSDYQKKLNNSNIVHTGKNIIRGKIYYKIKPEFKGKVDVYAEYYTKVGDIFEKHSKRIKSGQSLPKNTYRFTILATNKKNKLFYVSHIEK